MPGSNSVIRRYTPPTCTLEILAQSSPLSRWMGQTVLNQLRFQLYFDDPTLPEEKKITIQGDRDQLEALCNGVTNYVQQLLQQSADSFCLTSIEPQLSEPSEQSELDDVKKSSLSPNSNLSGMGILEATIYVESGKNLNHKLYLGSLGNQESGSIIELTLLQLFDLANALDEYASDVITLPNLQTESSSSVINLPSWTPIAAMIALAVGLTPITWQYANNFKNTQQQTAKNTTTTPETAVIESFPTPQSNIPNNLPSPPPNSDLIQTPNLDSSATLSDPTIGNQPLSFPNATVPGQAEKPSRQTQRQITPPIISAEMSPSVSSNSSQTLPEVIQPSRISPNIENNNSVAQNSRQTNVPASINSFPVTGNFSSERITSRQDPLKFKENSSSVENTALLKSDDLVARLRNAKKANLATVSNIAAEENKLLDVPQAKEAREILQRNWQPPADFPHTLEYTLILGVDGKIERILPLNRAAREYFDNTGIPAIGKPFVSTNKTGQNLKLRVFFSPGGQVQAFPENP
jgi:hypothetical protein